MVSVVGNAQRAFFIYYIGYLTLLCTPSLLATVRLSITDSDGAQLTYAGVGQPFRVSVETDARVVNSQPTIQGLKDYLCGETSFSEVLTPTAKLSHFSYVARIDEPGKYIVGPARMQVDGHEEVSATVQLEVKQEARTALSPDKKSQNKPFARLSVSQNNVFVREPFTCTLRFYFSRPQVRNVQGQSMDVQDTMIVDRQNAQQGSETIDGKTWNYVEWSWRLLSKKAGSLTLPACPIHFEEVQSGGFFFAHLLPKQIYSNAMTLEVHALPPCGEPVQAVGKFERCEARVDQSVARAGDALVLTLRVEGCGFFDDEQPIIVQGMPEALKWYESKKYDLNPERDGAEGKAFEFVVQGLREGEWEIPAQRIVYFNTVARECRTLASTPLQVTITPGQAVAGMVPIEPKAPSVALSIPADELSPSITGNGLAWYASISCALPSWLMVVLILVPSLVVAIALIRRRLLQTPLVRKKTLFSSAQRELRLLKQRGEVQELYALFTRLFARLYDDPAIDLVGENLQRRLRDAGLKSETLERWQQFADRCAESAFYTVDLENMSQESLLIVAEQWLLFFKERL